MKLTPASKPQSRGTSEGKREGRDTSRSRKGLKTTRAGLIDEENTAGLVSPKEISDLKRWDAIPLREVSGCSERLNLAARTSRSNIHKSAEDTLQRTAVPKAHIKLPLPTMHTEAASNKLETLCSLRARLIAKFQPQEPEEPPSDLLSMSVIERNQRFLTTKASNIKKRFQENYAKEFEECTFRPELATRRRAKNPRPNDSGVWLERADTRPTSRCSSAPRGCASYVQLYKRSLERRRSPAL